MTETGAWHPDPTGAHEYRWWNGTEWTEQVADGGVTSTHPLPGVETVADAEEPAPASEEPAQTSEARHPAPGAAGERSWAARNNVVILAALGALVVGLVVGALITGAVARSDLDDERAARADLEAELDDVHAELADVEAELEDRETRRLADEAATARAAADQEQEEREAEAAAQRAAEQQAVAEAEAAAERRTITRDGTYEVGRDIDPGRWRADAGGQTCYWAILSEPSGELGSIITNSIGSGPQIVDLGEGQYFESTRCGTWELD